MTAPVLVYDGDCGFCVSWLRAAERRVIDGADVLCLPWQAAEVDGPLRRRAQREVLLLHPDGRRVWGGVDAVAVLLVNSPHPYWRLLGSLLRRPMARGIGAAAYRWVARNRHRLPGAPPRWGAGE